MQEMMKLNQINGVKIFLYIIQFSQKFKNYVRK